MNREAVNGVATMKKQRQLLLIVLCAFFSAPALAGVSGAGLLKDFDGAVHSLSEYTGQGKWTIVMLWAADCHVCNVEAKHYVAFHGAHKNKDARMLGVSLDGLANKAEAEKFIQRHHINFPNLIETPEKIQALYRDLTGQAWIGTPTFLVYSPQGKLRAAQVGAVPVELIESFMAKEVNKELVKKAAKATPQ
jgi:peroxiredoxin